MSERIKKGRTLAVTVDDLLASKRFEIAVNNFKEDQMFMKAILIELGAEAQRVAKNAIIKTYSSSSSLNAFEMIPLLRSISDFKTYNIWWNMSEVEQQLYIADPKAQKTPEERRELLAKVKAQFMGSEAGVEPDKAESGAQDV